MRTYKDWEIQAILEALNRQAEDRGEQLNALRRERGLQPIASAKETSTAWMAAQVINQLQHEITLLVQRHLVTMHVEPKTANTGKIGKEDLTSMEEHIENFNDLQNKKIEQKPLRKQRKKSDTAGE